MSPLLLHGDGPATPPFESWPPLPLESWLDTRVTFHRWCQIVGKVRLAHALPVNHLWHAPLYLTGRGFTTTNVPFGRRHFQIDIDVLVDLLIVQSSDGEVRTMGLEPKSVADFHTELMAMLRAMKLETRIDTTPWALPGGLNFEQNRFHASYDGAYVRRFWRVLAHAQRVLTRFRGSFLGKSSPIHFAWSGFDLSLTFYSGRRAPPHPGLPALPQSVVNETYSHECITFGFWPGGEELAEPVFYAEAWPEPDGYRQAPDLPAGARYHDGLGRFILPYETMRGAADPDALLLEFLEATFEHALDSGGWDREALVWPQTIHR
jgi:hypothetical protein